MKNLTDTYLWDQIIRDAVEFRASRIFYEAGYRAGVRDTERPIERKDTKEKI
jgi:hypothetical protein